MYDPYDFQLFCAVWYCSWSNLGLNCQISNSTSIAASAQTTALLGPSTDQEFLSFLERLQYEPKLSWTQTDSNQDCCASPMVAACRYMQATTQLQVFKCTPHSMSITHAAVSNKFCRTNTNTQSVCTIHATFSCFCGAWYCSWNNLGLNPQISNSTSIAARAQTTALVNSVA